MGEDSLFADPSSEGSFFLTNLLQSAFKTRTRQKDDVMNNLVMIDNHFNTHQIYPRWVVTHMRLTNSKFCLLWVGMNHFEAHLMLSSPKVYATVLRMAI